MIPDGTDEKVDQGQINARAISVDHLTTGLGARSAHGVGVTMIVQALTLLIQLLNTAALARLLAPADFGVVALALSVTGFVGLFAELGLSTATVQREGLDQETASALFWLNIIAGLAGMLVCFAIAYPAALVYENRRILWAVLALGAIVPVSAAAVQHNALLIRGMRWWPIQLIGIASLIMGVITGIAGAWLFDAGYWALLAASATTALTRVIALWIVCPWRPSRVTDWRSARSAIGFGAHLTGFNLTIFAGRQADVMAIGWFWGATQAGFYSRAYQLMLIPLNAISSPLGGVFVPALSRLQNDGPRWADAFMRGYLIAAIIGCGFASVFAVTADMVINLIYGPGWDETIAIFRWLAWSMFCTFPMGAMAWAFVSLGNSRAMFHWGIISLAVLLISFLIAAPFSTLAVAQAYTIAIWILTPVCFHLALRKSPVSIKKALIEIALLWVASLVAALAGFEFKGLTDLGLVFDLVIDSLVTSAVFALTAFVLVFRRSEYRRMATSSWDLVTAALANAFGQTQAK